MRINSISASLNRGFAPSKNQEQKRNFYCAAIPAKTSHDTVSFGAIKGLQISKRVIDYGDIFVEGAKLIGEKLIRAKKTGAYLVNADLTGSNLQKSSFFGAMFDNANLTRTDFSGSNLSAARFVDTIMNETDLSYTNLYNAKFAGDKFGRSTFMQGANITSVDFKDADMSCINLYGAIYDEFTIFPRAFNPDEFRMFCLEKGADFSNIEEDLQKVKLRYSVLDNINFSNSSLKRADIKGSEIVNCNMHNTILTRAYAKETLIKDTDLSDSKLKQIQLTGAELINVDLRKANLKSALLDWRFVKNVDLRGAKYNSETVFTEGFNPRAAGMIFEDTELKNSRG